MNAANLVNELGQPIGAPLPDWTAPPMPAPERLAGRYCTLEPMSDRFAAELHAANANAPDARHWTYLPYGPFASEADYRRWISDTCLGADPLFHVITNAAGRAVGVAAYLRIQPEAGSIEIGHINYAPVLQRAREATEAMYLFMRRAFELGYRRYEWKCDALNAPSRAAARRLGFSFEGIFRQASVYKERSRDTAWYSIIDKDWPTLEKAFSVWLHPDNFDSAGRQRTRLSDLTQPLIDGRPS